MISILSLLFSFIVHANDDTHTKKPIEFDHDKLLKNVSDEEIKHLKTIMIELLEKKIWIWDDFRVNFPEGVIQKDERIIKMSDLFHEKKGENLEALARLNGNKLKLKEISQKFAEQDIQKLKETYKQTALIMIPSIDYPGHFHKWKFSWVFQTGEIERRKNYELRIDKAKNIIEVKIYNHIFDPTHPLSARSGLVYFLDGLYDTIDLFIGLPRQNPVYQDFDINNVVEEKRNRNLIDSIEPVDQTDTDNLYVVKEIGNQENEGKEFKTYDLSLYNSELESKVEDVLLNISQETLSENEKYYVERFEKLFKEYKELYPEKDDTRISAEIIELLQEEIYNSVLSKIQDNQELKDIRENAAELILERITSNKIIKRNTDIMNIAIYEFISKVEEQLKKQHPRRSKIEQWLKRQVDREVSRQSPEWKKTFVENTYQDLVDSNLKTSAFIFKKTQLEFLNIEREIRADLEKIFEYDTAKTKWKHPYYEKWNFKIIRPRKELNEEEYLQINQYIETTLTKKYPFWQFPHLAQIAWQYMSASYWWGASWVIKGPLGTQTLTDSFRGIEQFPTSHDVFLEPKGPESFEMKKTVDGRKLYAHPVEFQTTFAGYIRNKWQENKSYYSEMRSKDIPFANGAKNAIAAFWFLGAKGILLDGFVFPAIRLTATTLNIAVVGGLYGLTGWVLAPTAAIFDYLVVRPFIYDRKTQSYVYDKFSGKSRIQRKTAKNFAFGLRGLKTLLGLGQSAAMSTAVPALRATEAVGRTAFAHIIRNSSNAWDAIWRNVIFSTGVIPDKNIKLLNWQFLKRTDGPDLNRDYFFQINSDLALLIMIAEMDHQNALLYEGTVKYQSEMAKTTYNNVMSELFGGIGTGLTNEISEQILEQIVEIQKDIEQKSKVEFDKFDHLLDIPNADRIRLTEKELKEVLSTGQLVVKQYYEERIFKRLNTEQLDHFWIALGLKEGDWLGLTKKTLKDAFKTDQIIYPLEDFKFLLKYEVRNSTLEEIYSITRAKFDTKEGDVYDVEVPRINGIQIPKVPFQKLTTKVHYKLELDRKNLGEKLKLLCENKFSRN